MRKILNSAIAMLIFASCQKEITQKSISAVNQDDNEISTTSVADFIQAEQVNITDNHNGKVVCSWFDFYLTANNTDTAYPKRFTARITKDQTVKVSSITLYLDGVALDTRYNKDFPIGDTVHFNIVSPQHRAIPTDGAYYGKHTICMRLRGAQSNTGTYRVDLTEATFLNKADKPQTIFLTTGLPELGDIVTYYP